MQSQQPLQSNALGEGHTLGRRRATAAQVEVVLDLLDELWSAARRLGIMRLSPTQLEVELRRVAVAARDAKVMPEHFLWFVKETWAALPEVRAAADPDKARDQLSAIITLCIHEYYRD